MHKELLFAFVAFFLMSLNVVVGANTFEIQQQTGEIVIESWQKDVTGDGHKNVITLYGTPYDEDSPYFQKVWSIVQTKDGQKLRMDYDSGYNPTLQFVDLNHDQVLDVFYSSATGGNGGIYHYAAHSTKSETVEDLAVPDPLTIVGKFKQDYQAVVTFKETGKSYQINLMDRKKNYDLLNLYENGTLVKPTRLMIAPFTSLEVVNIDNETGKGLKGTQLISGAYHADSIGVAQSEWYFEKGKWKLKKMNWSPLQASTR
ncbi:hypothetical protein WAK64_19590 [Bacillus spongiae]|uniref:VCBS repeat-containing protein n=1 Tax=Bacillus spongiae TaxID=2683610 RepID=A0ABU8HIM1_9BACI